jgi:hypothetical protein
MVLAARLSAVAVLLAAALLAGCGARRSSDGRASELHATRARWPLPIPVGQGPAFRLAPHGWAAARAATIDHVRCSARPGARVLAHVELFARGRVVPVPPGIGIAPPLVHRGAYVRGGRCSYPVRTTEPTGLLELRSGARLTLGELFAIWGQPLSRTRLAGFRAPVRTYLDGHPWHGDPRATPLHAHAVVVLEVGRVVAPHARYRFPPNR